LQTGKCQGSGQLTTRNEKARLNGTKVDEMPQKQQKDKK